jgi:hypothetical protein
MKGVDTQHSLFPRLLPFAPANEIVSWCSVFEQFINHSPILMNFLIHGRQNFITMITKFEQVHSNSLYQKLSMVNFNVNPFTDEYLHSVILSGKMFSLH